MAEEPPQNDGFQDHLSDVQRALDPEFVDAYHGLRRAASRRCALTPVVRELIGLAINAAVTHLNISALRRHIQCAIDAGATSKEIVETLEITSVLGMHTISIGLPALLDELNCDLAQPLTESQSEVKDLFTRRRGAFHPTTSAILYADEEYLRAYSDFSGLVWDRDDGLEPKIREFIYLANNASTTHLLEPGIRSHGRRAIEKGATIEELLEVLEITSLLGFQSFVEGTRELLAICPDA